VSTRAARIRAKEQEMKKALVLVWAVLCSNGSVHVGEECSYLFLDEDQAKDILSDTEWEGQTCSPWKATCGPHKIIALRKAV